MSERSASIRANWQRASGERAPAERHITAFRVLLALNAGIEKNTSARTIKDSNPSKMMRSTGACMELLHRLCARDPLLRQQPHDQGIRAASAQNAGCVALQWPPDDASTPQEAAQMRPADVTAPAHLASTCDGAESRASNGP